MDYKNLKKGNVIVISWNSHNMLAIFDKFGKTYGDCDALFIYAEMDLETNELYFRTDDCEFSYELTDISYRLATEEEKNTLYNAIGKYFTEEYDKDWYNHFTDSSYFDIQDFLFDVFCIKVEEYDNDMIYPDFVDEIHSYIWEKLCKSMGYKNYDGDEFVEQLVNKQEFIEKAKEWLENTLYIHTEIENDRDFNELFRTDWVTSDYDSIEDFINSFCKAMEE